jgi:hypothetical protein
MSRAHMTFLTLWLAALAACSPAGQPSATLSSPSASPSNTPASPSASVTPSAPASPSASLTNPPPSTVQPTADEAFLLDGVRRGGVDCVPVRDALPTAAIAGIECGSDVPGIAQVGFYLFDTDEAMLAAYFERMDAEGVAQESGSCQDGEREQAYTPGGADSPFRNGCFINAEGFANYRATIPGLHVYIGVLGDTDDTGALEDFAWVGNQDQPGNPTLWAPSN